MAPVALLTKEIEEGRGVARVHGGQQALVCAL
jgi:hypothetical protein